MFAKNEYPQMKMYDSVQNMPKYLQDILYDSWAHPFQKEIFPEINEERFSVLYSDKPSRPNSPVNVIIGALILKELFGLTDEQLVGSIYFDTRFEYALRLTSEKTPPISLNTFTNFRNRVYAYYNETGIDLIQNEMEALADIIAEKLEIEGKRIRIDSFMVSSSLRNLSRVQLVYTVNYQFIKMLNKLDKELIPESCLAYLEPGHEKETIYKTRDSEAESKIETLLKHSKALYDAGVSAGSKVTETEEFKTLKRMIAEQTKDDDDFNVITPKDNKEISAKSLQNPSDPDATYRFKYDDNQGYVANIVETFDKENSVIKSYDFKPNIYSDQKFSSDTIEKLEPKNPIQAFVDGTYYTYELAKKALEKGIKLIPGELSGKKPAADKMSFTSFRIENDIIVSCAAGKIPIYTEKNKDTYYAVFEKDGCSCCELKEECRIDESQNINSVSFTEKRYETDRLREEMGTKEYKKLTNQRNAIEGVPSVFRRKYNVDYMPVRGLVRSKVWFGLKVGAYNVKKLFKRLQVAGV